MTATPYTTLIGSIRVEVDDPSTGQSVFRETPLGVRDGVNVLFQLQNKNIVANTPLRTYGSTVRSNAGFTVADAVAGVLQLSSPPDLNITFPFVFDYYFQWVIDADYQTWIDTATLEVGGASGTDPGSGLYPAVIAFVAAKFWARRSSDAARKAQASGGGAEENLTSQAKAFLDLSREAYKRGCSLRDDFYKRFGKRNAPASYTITQGVTPYQTRR